MALLFRRKVILAKTEVTYGTDPTPTGASNAILTSNLSITPIQANMLDRNLDRVELGNDISIHDGVHVACSFDVELAGSGAAGTAPGWSPLIQACGFDETITASTSVAYQPVSTGFSSVTIYYNIDGQQHKMTGCRGSVSFNISTGGLPMLSFSMTGLYNAPSSVAMPTADVSGFVQPVAVNDTNTTTATLHSETLVCESFSCDMSNDVQYRNLVNDEKVIIVDRAPSGSVSFEAPALSTKNWFTTAVANTTGALQIVHGTTAGNIATFDAPAVQVTEPNYNDSQGQAMITGNLRFIPNTGDDEVVLTLT